MTRQEITEQDKKAKIDLLKALIDGYGRCYLSPVGNEKYKVCKDKHKCKSDATTY